MSKIIEAQKAYLAERARELLKGSRMFGEPIDPNNIEDALAAFVVCHDLLEQKDSSYRVMAGLLDQAVGHIHA